MTDLVALKVANEKRWVKAKLTRGPEFTPVAKRLFAAKDRYKAVEARTGVPWFFIACAHQRESSQDFSTSLAQGDPWNKVSTHVPAGRGPFSSWEAAAYDALVNCAPYAAKNEDWSAGGTMTMLERYNGLGYFTGPVTKRNGVVIARYPSQPSPYVWSGTDQYTKGKYVADGVFDQNTVDKQLGCAGIILALMKLDPSITFEKPPLIAQPTKPAPVVMPAPPAAPSFWASVATIFSSLFRKA